LENAMNEQAALTSSELEQVRSQAVRLMRSRLEQSKPNPDLYVLTIGRASRWVTALLVWSKAFIPLIALLAALASSVRTVQTASEIYASSGSHPVGVILAAIAFTVSVEGALFVLALAREGEQISLRKQRKPRHVQSLRSLWYGIQVRIGLREPRRYDELPEQTHLEGVMLIAFLFAVMANLYMGIRPLMREIGSMSLQEFFSSLWSSPASLQLTFLVDFAGVLFPPLMALAAGHLTARFAAEFTEQSRQSQDAFETETAQWRDHYENPLNSDEGQQMLAQLMNEKRRAKALKRTRSYSNGTDFLAHQQAAEDR
jgi:hypothetical protein